MVGLGGEGDGLDVFGGAVGGAFADGGGGDPSFVSPLLLLVEVLKLKRRQEIWLTVEVRGTVRLTRHRLLDSLASMKQAQRSISKKQKKTEWNRNNCERPAESKLATSNFRPGWTCWGWTYIPAMNLTCCTYIPRYSHADSILLLLRLLSSSAFISQDKCFFFLFSAYRIPFMFGRLLWPLFIT